MDALDQLVLPLVTTWPAFTEAMYLLARAGGIRAQQALWRLVATERLVVANLSPSAVRRPPSAVRRPPSTGVLG